MNKTTGKHTPDNTSLFGLVNDRDTPEELKGFQSLTEDIDTFLIKQRGRK